MNQVDKVQYRIDEKDKKCSCEQFDGKRDQCIQQDICVWCRTKNLCVYGQNKGVKEVDECIRSNLYTFEDAEMDAPLPAKRNWKESLIESVGIKKKFIVLEPSKRWDPYSYNSNVHYIKRSNQLQAINSYGVGTTISKRGYGGSIGERLPGFKLDLDVDKKNNFYPNHQDGVQTKIHKYADKQQELEQDVQPDLNMSFVKKDQKQ